VVILERSRFPRYKVCAGGVPSLLFDLVGNFPYERKFDQILLKKGRREWRLNLARPILTVKREEFDTFLLDRARGAGCEIRFEPAQKIDGDRVVVESGSYEFRYLIGADGAGSLVRKAMGLEFHRWVRTIEFEISGRGDELIVRIGPGPGYAWFWPKKETIAFGAGGFGDPNFWLEPFAEELGLRPEGKGYRYRYPIWEKKERIRGRMILIGDAGGFASPLTGAGIYTGILSALAAGRMILTGRWDPFFRSLYPELIPASQLAPFLYHSPGLLIDFVRPSISRNFGRQKGYYRILRLKA